MKKKKKKNRRRREKRKRVISIIIEKKVKNVPVQFPDHDQGPYQKSGRKGKNIKRKNIKKDQEVAQENEIISIARDIEGEIDTPDKLNFQF